MKIFDSNKIVHATYSAGETFWNVTECKGDEGCVYIVQKHTNYDIPKIIAEFGTKKAAIGCAEECYKLEYETEWEKSKRMWNWQPR